MCANSKPNSIVKAEVHERVELVQVLLYLAHEQEKTVQHLTNKVYAKRISDWFAPYQDHPAVKMTKKLIVERSFFHTRPLRAILDLDNILADNAHELNAWARETARFAEDSGFHRFFSAQNEYYADILQHINSCDLERWVASIESYFKCSPNEFHLVICPIAGNYGFNLSRGERQVAYTVRCMPYYDEQGNPLWQFDFFAKGVAHEYAHCFVNPVVEGRRELLNGHAPFFEAHHHMPQSYNVDYAVINEYIVRAFGIRFMEENRSLFPAFDVAAEYERQRKSFVFIERFVAFLRDFENSSMTFSAFYGQHIEEILRECESRLGTEEGCRA